MLRYTTLGSKIILGFFLTLVALAAYLPFLEAFALTPAIAFVHRFSITLNIGNTTKTLQPIVFVLPILLIKGLWEYHKRHNLLSLFKTPLASILTILIAIDLVSVITTTDRGETLSTFITHGMNLAVFVTSSLWLSMVAEHFSSEKLKKFGIKLVRVFAISLAAFTITNTVISTSQFFDCSLSNSGCHIWKTIDEVFPNKLLLVGHQKFSYKPNIIRAPGFFGDVNFNGMYSLFIVLLFGTLFLMSVLLQTEKGYLPTKEQRFLVLVIGFAFLSFLLTFSRSAMVGAAVTGVILFLIIFVPIFRNIQLSKKLTRNLIIYPVYGVIAIGIVFLFGYFVPLSYNGRQTSLSKEIGRYVGQIFSPDDKSAQGHASLFESAIIIGNQKPLVGMGMGTFGVQYQKLIRPDSDTNASPHSTYGLLYAEQGLVGVVGYLGIIVYLWAITLNSLKKLTSEIITLRKKEKKFSREHYIEYGAKLCVALIGMGIPFFSIATITYYGFFLPMTWWWGNKETLELRK